MRFQRSLFYVRRYPQDFAGLFSEAERFMLGTIRSAGWMLWSMREGKQARMAFLPMNR